MDLSFDGKIVLITGAAAGIGSEIARQFVLGGATVIGVDRDWSHDAGNPSVRQVTIDVSDRDAVQDIVRTLSEEMDGLDILVNNAGIIRARESLFAYDEGDWQSILAVNTSGVFFCLQAAAKVMRERGTKGAIINMASGAGRTGQTLSPPYAASKAAVINITRSSALALASDGIRVNAVAPGIIDTDFNRRLGEQFGPSDGLTPEEYVASRAARVPLGRLGTATDVAQVVCFLASPLAGYITGQTLNVDGGMVLS
jgi:NAD(P)-dependent dehydrogenase (short-subunit alcohol dehydrogenase family)